MDQWLKVLVALADNASSIPSTNKVTHNHIYSSSRGLTPSSNLCGH